ncbi:MAG: DEAD/DEAH box helicase [Planctomycetes bacterium]|nr:DEAD/DEAH box helicase [Planctomycetota bacterium]
MTDSWIHEALGAEAVDQATNDAGLRRLIAAIRVSEEVTFADDELRFVAESLELRILDLIRENAKEQLRPAAEEVFQIARALPPPDGTPIKAAEWYVRIACIGVLGDRSADVQRYLREVSIPKLPLQHVNWGRRVRATILDVWLRLLRKKNWEDLDGVHQSVASLRSAQKEYEPAYLGTVEEAKKRGAAWALVVCYHMAKAAEILGTYLTQGEVDGTFDVIPKLEQHLDRATAASERSADPDLEALCRILQATAPVLAMNSIWTLSRGVSKRAVQLVERLVGVDRRRPIFELLPPQRAVLREEGLLGSGHRAVVVNLPTSSGKTIIAEFRIIQALNQFEAERGWVAYVAPTRALVNQLTLRFRRDFGPLGIVVEKVSPALEIDGIEASMLCDDAKDAQFRILVTTPEKLALMLRGDWEAKINRPLSLVVVDEAHGLASENRGIKLELLLATINRECRHAQFLLLTPFIRNGKEIATWLDPVNSKNIEIGVEWTPNDRLVAIARREKGAKRGQFRIDLEVQQVSQNTLDVSSPLVLLNSGRPLSLTYSQVKAPGKLAAAVAQLLQDHGTVIVLVSQPNHSWGVANAFKVEENRSDRRADGEDLRDIRAFLAEELGEDFPLIEQLNYGVAVHHAGLSDDTRTLVEWLTEQSKLKVLVATTTIAQGVNFPVSGVVYASHQYPYGADMPPEDFWNVAGRAGRVDQGDLGIVALVAPDEENARKLRTFLNRAVRDLNSTLIEMVRQVQGTEGILNLQTLSHLPNWSAFVQYLAHTYRQIDNHDEFVLQVEQILRGTLGFQTLRRTEMGWARQLIRGVSAYASRMKGKPLRLVDATGFSLESVENTLGRLQRARISADAWSADLFTRGRDDVRKMMGVLLEVPELRDNLTDVTGGPQPDGATLARIVCDWVEGRPLKDMAEEYFSERDLTEEGGEDVSDAVAAMTRCCSRVFGKLTQSASWGLAALQSLTLRDSLDGARESEQRTIRNLPARVFYGVNTDEAIALRLLGVPRTAATPLAKTMKVSPEESISSLRARLTEAGVNPWSKALGRTKGKAYHRVWSIIEGVDS